MDESRLRNHSILITGANGFTGQHACRYFSGLGMRVTGMVRSPVMPDNRIQGVNYVECDLLDREGVIELVRHLAPEFVLHLAGKNSVPESWREPVQYIESNALAAIYLLDALREFKNTVILIAGSRLSFQPDDHPAPPHPYSLSKTIEHLSALSWHALFGQSILLAEPGNLIGPGPSTGFCSLLGRYIVAVERGENPAPFRISSREERRDFLDVRDAVSAYAWLLAYGRAGEKYPVCSGRETTLEHSATVMLNLAKCPVPLQWGAGERSERLADPVKDSLTSADGKAGEPTPPLPARETAETLPTGLSGWGWSPSYSLKASAADILSYFRNQEVVVS
ncbi:NAD-dependent epimerase/dehydratase family protein [Paenibacillus sp. BR2-3]|uniref:NAD-dependent epimerase/dehydratase family protein n=1 Tax=Paenibacillus sp. BR2-3 TaxID=3048494 RepID=UPI003977A556